MWLENGSSTPQKSIKSKHPDPPANDTSALSLREHCSWNDFSSAGVGTADFPLILLDSMAQVECLKDFRQRGNLSFFPLGAGTNVIGSDTVLQNRFCVKLGKDFQFLRLSNAEPNRIHCGAGVPLRKLLLFAMSHNLGGAHGLSGIPGTVGGAVCMNAGACGMQISDFLVCAEIYSFSHDAVSLKTKEELRFHYRSSSITEDELILSATFHFQTVLPDAEKALFQAESVRRSQCPQGKNSGSVFRNIAPDISAGKLLDRSGAKKIARGTFHVSDRHANWIIRESGDLPGKETDYIQTLTDMITAVKQKTGILLRPETRFFNMESEQTLSLAAKPLKILVLKGGVSSERQISLESGANVAKNLRVAGHDVREFDIKELAITDDMRWADVVYPVLHGGYGEDGRLQKLLEDAKIKFVGISSEACRIIMDKVASKQVMDANGITNAAYQQTSDVNLPFPKDRKLPLIVKPASEGSTFGLTLVEEESQWHDALTLAGKYDSSILIEDYISGIESTVGILLGKALPLVEIRYPGKLYDYDAKYTHAQGETQYLCPPTGISQKAQENAKREAEKFAEAVGATELLRVDVIITPDDRAFVLEGNSMPGCTASSLLPKAAAAMGISGPEMCSRLAMAAYEKP